MLSLDGGGVRGLSSLLILQHLLSLVTRELIKSHAIEADHPPLHPQDVFDVAVGTSTGGLIVLMIVKLNMPLDECIAQYKVLSRDIFAKPRSLSKRIFGSDWSKFSGTQLQKAVERLLVSQGHVPDLKLRCSALGSGMQGSVLCHEKPNPHPVFFCTHECQGPYRQHMLNCDLEVRDAARATSAAPSYFEPVTIQGRSFVDGGYGETNNPSWEGKLHYHKNHHVSAQQQLIMVNIGTGTLPEKFGGPPRPRRPLWTKLLPNSLVEARGLLSDLVKMATESEQRARDLYYMSEIVPEQLFFERFSADTGIHHIKLDDWRSVVATDGPSEIEAKTTAYLRKLDVQARLQTTAERIADVYVKRNMPKDAAVPRHPADDTRISLSISIGSRRDFLDTAPAGRMEFQDPQRAAENLPSLVTGSEWTHSPGPSHPPTPDPVGRSSPPLRLLGRIEELLREQGGQFADDNPTPKAPALVDAPVSFHPLRRPRRSSTVP